MVQSAPSRLQEELARRILRLLKEESAPPGHHLVELDLCARFGVSRTPVRGALKLLAERGVVAPGGGRGFRLTGPVTDAPDDDEGPGQDEEDKQIILALAKARQDGRLPEDCAQQEIVRRLGVRLGPLLRVLRQMADLGLVARKPGNGWTFRVGRNAELARARSYALRHAIEPAALLEPGFRLEPGWTAGMRARHRAMHDAPWHDGLVEQYHALNDDFHEHLARQSGNRFMHAAVRQQIQLRRFLRGQWSYGRARIRDALDEHLELLDALEAGRNDEAARLMAQHLTLPTAWTDHSAPEAFQAVHRMP